MRGEVRYLQIPAVDVEASARFYEQTLGWAKRVRADGSVAFDDTSGHVSGEWLPGRQAVGDAGVLVHVRVEDVAASLALIVEAGGEVVVPRTPQGEDIAYATFRDPAGNVLGIFQEGG